MECPHCGLLHTTTCPRVRSIKYRRDGSVKKLEFHHVSNPIRVDPQLLQTSPPPPSPPISPKSKRLHGLSLQEVKVLVALARGDQNKVIARELNIAEATVKVHVKAILRKLNLRNRTQAATWFAAQPEEVQLCDSSNGAIMVAETTGVSATL